MIGDTRRLDCYEILQTTRQILMWGNCLAQYRQVFWQMGHTYQDLPKYRGLVNCNILHGTMATRVSKVIGHASRRTWKTSKQFLSEGNCIMLLRKDGDGRHYFVIGMDQTEIFMMNRFRPDVGVTAAYVISPSRAAMLVRTSQRTWYVDKATGLL